MASWIDLYQISSWDLKKRWFSPETCMAKEFITCIRISSNEQLALSIRDENDPINPQFRFELRDINLNSLHKFSFCTTSGIFSRMTPLPDAHWTVLNVDTNHVFILNDSGKLIDKIDCHHEKLCNITLIGKSTVVIRADNKLFFYDVKFGEERQNP
jgi:hypothetical protein